MPVHKTRRFDRRAFDRIGALDAGDGSASMACEILDISAGGARLAAAHVRAGYGPDRFTLLLSACGHVRRTCRVAWRSAVGIRGAILQDLKNGVWLIAMPAQPSASRASVAKSSSASATERSRTRAAPILP